MKIYAIGDLHLPGGQDKAMDIFGSHWENHWDKIKKNWLNIVEADDIVLIPGDISWAMHLEEALEDLEDIGNLPGKKIMIKGNHDYWWSSISRIRNVLHDSIFAIQNDSLYLEPLSLAFCGTRGWTTPGGWDFSDHDEKIFSRELNRLKLSLDSAKDAKNIIVLLHYPPFDDKGQESKISHLIAQYPVQHVLFGHLHGDSFNRVFEGPFNDIEYHLVSCDYLDFQPKFITEF
ncbi:MAG TPA: metallophosphoesterase [Clostridia bacterium]|nr:metallophosphoesterase [Clostridia bacterium]